jgi:ubiquinone/menaquinone biosynthesis C-methylase UbiE
MPWALNRIIEPSMLVLRIQIPEFAGMKVGDRVLDICCGTGALALHYARMGIIAAGIDLDPRVLQVADIKRRKQGLRNVSFLIATASDLPIKDNLFDYASISMSLHEKERDDRDRIVTEMKRVVKKEGTLVFIDYKIPLPRIPISSAIKAIEFIAGRKHWKCFNDYVKQGGLGELLKRNYLHQDKYFNLGPFYILKTLNSQ